MRRIRAALFLFLFILIARVALADDASSVNEYFSRLAAHGFSGAVLIAHGEQVVLRKGYGLADRKRGIPNRGDTAFNIASLDKQFIAAGILRLEEMGKLSTRDPISRVFDFVPAEKKNVTLHQVLTHTAGFSDEYWDEHPDLTRAEFIRWVVTNKALLSPPGTKFSYAVSTTGCSKK